VSDGSRTDKTYKDKDVNTVAKALREYSGVVVTPTQVYNHLRKWKQKWAKVAKLKDLSGATFDDDCHVKALCLALVISDNAQVLIMCLRLYVAKDD
jgi:hypothetical protein